MATLTQKKVFAALPRTERAKAVRLTGQKDKFLYCNGNSVYIRNVKNPLEVDIYTQHSRQTTVARYSPSGFYIASGDTGGKIRIWDTINPEHILKKEYPVLGGEIRDIAWSPDSQKIAAGGEGSEKYAHVFTMDTGTSNGELTCIGKAINAVAYRQERPFRLVAASEDAKVYFYKGPPFKYEKTLTHHTSFVNVARYSPDGSIVISGSTDKRLFKYEGKELEMINEIGSAESPVHKGGIYEICFGPEGKEILTVSGDKSAKIFDVESGDCLCTFNMDMGKDSKTAWHDMQLGALWQDGEILTINGLGHITYHDRNNPTQPKRVIKGHMKPITALALSEDKTTAFTGGQEGIFHWDVESGDNDQVCGKGHTSQVTDMVIDDDSLISVGIDDTLRVSCVSSKDFSDIEVKLDSQPRAVDSRNGTVVVVCINHIIVLDGERGAGKGKAGFKKRLVHDLKTEPASVSIHPNGSTFAVGFKAKEIRIYSPEGGSLAQKQSVKVPGEVSCLAYSPDGASLAYSTDNGVGVRNTEADYEIVNKQVRSQHTARVTSLAWSPDSIRFASGSLDSMLIVWKKDMVFEQRPIIKAHTMSHINKLAWVDANTIITAGQDSNVKQFTVSSE